MKDGRIVLTGGGTLSPRMSRELLIAAVPDAELFDETGEYQHYAIGPTDIGGRLFRITATLKHGILWMISLTDEDMSQAGWSFGPELVARSKAGNDAWLASLIGRSDGRFPWGLVESGIDVKLGTPSIVVRYD